jgi:hypothetical protein
MPYVIGFYIGIYEVSFFMCNQCLISDADKAYNAPDQQID